MDIQSILHALNIQDHNHGVMIGTESFGSGPTIDSISPVDGKKIASLSSATADEYERAVRAAQKAFHEWSNKPPVIRARVLFKFKEIIEKNHPRT